MGGCGGKSKEPKKVQRSREKILQQMEIPENINEYKQVLKQIIKLDNQMGKPHNLAQETSNKMNDFKALVQELKNMIKEGLQPTQDPL